MGVDGIYSRTVNEIIRDELETLGGRVVGEATGRWGVLISPPLCNRWPTRKQTSS